MDTPQTSQPNRGFSPISHGENIACRDFAVSDGVTIIIPFHQQVSSRYLEVNVLIGIFVHLLTGRVTLLVHLLPAMNLKKSEKHMSQNGSKYLHLPQISRVNIKN